MRSVTRRNERCMLRHAGVTAVPRSNPMSSTFLPSRLDFAGRVIIIGCGSIGQGILPVIGRHIPLEGEGGSWSCRQTSKGEGLPSNAARASSTLISRPQIIAAFSDDTSRPATCS